MRLTLGLCAVLILAGARPAGATDCIMSGPLPRFSAGPIEWTMRIASGKRCVRGFRTKGMLLDSVTLTEPARHGEATILGYGFAYQAPADFKGEDSFAVRISGVDVGMRGDAVIQVRVSVR